MRCLLPFLVLSIWLVSAVWVCAQFTPKDWEWNRKFEAGDVCRCFFLGEWRSGTVQAVKGKNVQVAVEFAGTVKTEVYDRGYLRFLWEAEALTPPRQWTDSSGKFNIRASLMAVNAKTKEARLHKIEDDEEISISIEKLCEADRTFIGKVLGATVLTEGALPDIEIFATGDKVLSSDITDVPDHLGQMVPDPLNSKVQLPMSGIPFAKNDFHEHINRLVPIGGAPGWVATSTTNTFDKSPNRLLWCSLTDKKIAKTHFLPMGHRVLSIDPASNQVLTACAEDGHKWKAPILTLWKGSPFADVLEPMMRWRSETEDFAQNNWSEFIDADHVVHRWGRSSYVVWNTQSKHAEFSIEQNSFFVSDPKLSPGRRYLVLPEDDGIRIADLSNGEVVAFMPMKQPVSAVCFDPDCKYLYAMTIDELWIWSVGSSESPRKMVAQSLGSPFGCNLEWISDRRILINDSVLYDVELEQPIWHYTIGGSDDGQERRDALIRIVDNKICYTANEIQFDNWLLVVGAVDLPGPGVEELVSQVDFEKLFLTKAGTPVKLVVDCDEYTEKIKEVVGDRIVNAVGWQLTTDAELTLRARMYEGPAETAEYVLSNGETQFATAKRFVSSLELTRGDKLVWSSASVVGGLPPLVFVRSNQTVQGQIDRFRVWDTEFFGNVFIPTRILDPKYKFGLGKSAVGLQGITMKMNYVTPSIKKEKVEESSTSPIR